MTVRQSYSLEEIKDMLHAQIDAVAHHYAPPAKGSYTDKGLYFTLNPGRADRNVGSFCIHMSGPKIGRWADYALSGRDGMGDVLDLIRLSMGCSPADAIREARAFLGLQHDTPELRRRRADAVERARQNRIEAERKEAAAKKNRARRAQAIWLSAEPQIAGTPVELYLQGRAINLRELGRQPGAIRYLRECLFHADLVDPASGEVCEIRQVHPAMVASIVNGKGETIALHRTYLTIGPDGIWGKVRIPHPFKDELMPAKKVFGDYRGGCIRLSNGIDPNGNRGPQLAKCPPGTRVYIAEGIETALSAVILRPEARVLAAIGLSNMGNVQLPRNVAEVVLIADGDDHPQAVASLEAAVQAHAAQGRTVRIWRSDVPGEDLNDALKRAMKERGAA